MRIVVSGEITVSRGVINVPPGVEFVLNGIVKGCLDPSVPPGTCVVTQDGKEVLRIVNLGS